MAARGGKIKLGIMDRPLTGPEIEVLTESLDDYQQAMRYGAGIVDGDDRRRLLDKARVATRLLGRVEVEQERCSTREDR